MNNPNPTRRSARIASAAALLVALAVASAAPAWPQGGGVMPASAKPHGYSLTEMASAVAPFTMSDNDPGAYPNTPFQILYVNNIDYQEVDGGIVATATTSFTVPTGRPLYLPIFNSTDGEPVVGTVPATAAEAPFHLFVASQYGGTFEIIVDGSTTPIGAEYVAGPVAVAGHDLQIVTLGAFVGPLSPGSHTITARGGVYGAALAEAHGISYIELEFTYNVQVQPVG